MPLRTRHVCVASATLVVTLGCASPPLDPRYPPRPPGCAIDVFSGRPGMPVDELGSVSVLCEWESPSRCWRGAMEEVCRRGGDVVWGVADSVAAARGGSPAGMGLPLQIAVGHTRLANGP
jgi:hypothetical protein